MKKYLNLKTALIVAVFIMLLIAGFILYRIFWQFNDKDVKTYIDEQARKYVGNEAKAAQIIKDGVEHILSSHNLTQQVLRSAKASNTPREMELVNAATAQCRAFGYID